MNSPVLSTLRRALIVLLCIVPVLFTSSCTDKGEDLSESESTVSISLRNTDTYQYSTVGGDEEGAVVVRQAQHYRISEIRRNASTNWVCVYVYQPEAGYVGTDYAEVEIHTNKVGTPENDRVTKLAFSFSITK